MLILLAVLATPANAERHEKTQLIIGDMLLGSPPAEGAQAACADSLYYLSGSPLPSPSKQGYYINNTANAPGGLDPQAVAQSIDDGFASWNNVFNDCGRPDFSSTNFHRIGLTEHNPELVYGEWYADGVNTIGFGDGPFFQPCAPCTIARTAVLYQGTQVLEYDIALNPYVPWALTGGDPANHIDIWNTIAHEAGWVMGLTDVGTKCSAPDYLHWYLTMLICQGYGETFKRSLGLGDMLGFEIQLTRIN